MKVISTKLSNIQTRQNVYGCILMGFSFMVLTLLSVKTLAPQIETNAASQTASQTVGPYTMSMANDSVASINITPTNTQSVYTVSNNLTVKNTCDAGATITMTTNSTTSNALVRTGTDSMAKEIAATTTTSLDNNSWGYALSNSSTYYAVPKKGATAATIYNASAAQTTNLTVPVKFGVKTDNSMPSGTYTNDVVYTMTPKAGCLTYTVTWDFDGGTAKSGATYPTSLSWGQTVNLSTLTPTRDGYTFAGWSNGSSNYTGTETAVNLNSSNAKTVTIKAKWTLISNVKNFSYTGAAQTFTAPYTGYYKVELWGAQGGKNVADYGNVQAGKVKSAGYGGYVSGQVKISNTQSLYVYVGQKGPDGLYTATTSTAWNGGGKGDYDHMGESASYGQGIDSGEGSGAGGGATDVRTASGAWNNATSLRSRVIVAGGGGGNSYDQNGGYGGGLTAEKAYYGSSATQTSGYAFGIGQDGAYKNTNVDVAGGGGGWYGGYAVSSGAASVYKCAGGGGSSYISGHTGSVAVTSTSSSSPKSGCTTGTTNNACSISPYGYTFTNTIMIDGAGYKWTNTKGALTAMPNPSGGTYASGVGHSGNGYARITWLGDTI